MKKLLLLVLLTSMFTVGCGGQVEKNRPKTISDSEPKVSETETIKTIMSQDEPVAENLEVEEVVDDSQYLDVFRTALVEIGDVLDKIYENLSDAERDESLYSDRQWMNEMRELFFKVSLNEMVMTQIKNEELVPNKYRDAHDMFSLALSNMKFAGNSFDDNDIQNGLNYMNMGAKLLKEMQEEVSRIASQN